MYFRIGEFARQAGVTVRALRYYEQVGLLSPSARSEAGQRLYTERDMARLQQILTLKLIGLSLEEIASLLTNDLSEIGRLLGQQKQALEAKARQLDRIIQTIERAEESLRTAQAIDLEQFINIIKAVNMNTQADWFSQFMNDEQKRMLTEQPRTLAEQKAAGQAWKALFEEVKVHVNDDVNDPAVQELVERWDGLLGQLAQGDPTFADLLNRLYTRLDSAPDVDTLPLEVREWVQGLQDAAAFMQRAHGVWKGE